MFQIIVAVDRSNGIGKEGSLPWSLPGDLAYFRELTSKTRDASRRNAVIMGRKTWESIPEKFKPLKSRLNIVLSRSFADEANHKNDSGTANLAATAKKFELPPGVLSASSLSHAMDIVTSMSSELETVFVIGGGQVYAEALSHPACSAVHLTRIDADYGCDTFFPALDPQAFRVWSASQVMRDVNGTPFSFICYTRGGETSTLAPPASPILPPAMSSRHDEMQYLDLVDRIIKCGIYRPDRTGTRTYSLFGCSMRYDLRHTFPLLTTKRVFWRGVVEELLWFVQGSTNASLLQDKGVRIWDGNSSREYLDSIGLSHREEGDLGPVYGFQWRHFGADYKDMHADYTGQGVDQLADVIHRLKTNPSDRRIIMTAWNPAALKLMALPPCHMFCQFYVADGELSCLMYQRSCDVGLGVPFNIASYSLLTLMIAQVCGLKPGEFVHMMGDTHVYANHVDPLKEQLLNAPRHFPTLKIHPDKREVDSFVFEDFEVVGYNPHKKIEMKMAV